MRPEALLAALSAHLSSHPAATAQDAAKFLYQALYGPGHMVESEAGAESWLRREAETLPAGRSAALFEPLSNEYARLDLSALAQISPETMAKMFCVSAKPEPPEKDALAALLQTALERGLLPGEDAAGWVARYTVAGCPATHHSEAYRIAYCPAYRVVRTEFTRFLPLFAEIDRLLAGGAPVCAAIDGMCGSGKTTLAALLAEVYGCAVFHADDFFLPPELRTPERYAAPGGNLHWERLLEEVLLPLRKGLPVAFRPFDCSVMALTPEPVCVEPQRLSVVEGSYALHPQLCAAYDLKVFLKTDAAEQEARILRRNGASALEVFREKWIPLENRYFAACRVEERSDLVFRT